MNRDNDIYIYIYNEINRYNNKTGDIEIKEIINGDNEIEIKSY